MAEKISRLQNIQDDRVYIFHGTGDETVRPGAAEALEDFYAELGISDPASQILSKTDLNATHALASDHSGTPCGEHNDELYIENCDYERLKRNQSSTDSKFPNNFLVRSSCWIICWVGDSTCRCLPAPIWARSRNSTRRNFFSSTRTPTA